MPSQRRPTGPRARRIRRAPAHPQCTTARRRQPGGLDELPDAVITAHRLAEAGDAAGAVVLLGRYLQGRDYSWFPVDPVLIDACTLYAELADGAVRLSAAHYAHRASRRLHEPDHPRSVAAARVYGTVLHQHARFDQAAAIRRGLLDVYRALGEFHESETVWATADLAASLHAGGHCAEAIDVISEAWRSWRAGDVNADPTCGATILHIHLRMLRSCGRKRDLISVVHQARRTSVAHALAAVRTIETRQADNDYISEHRATVCTHQRADVPTAEHSEVQLQAPGRAATRNSRHDGPPHPLAGYHARDIESAISHLLTTPDVPAGADKVTAREVLARSTAQHLARRRARRVAVGSAVLVLSVAALLFDLHA